MIVNRTYKVSWKHFNKEDVKVVGDGEKLAAINSIVNKAVARGDIMQEVTKLFQPELVFSRSFSKCLIEKKKDTGEYAPMSSGLAIVHPNDSFNRKKGVFIAFDDAVANIEDREVRGVLWNAYWAVRKDNKKIKKQTNEEFNQDSSNSNDDGPVGYDTA